MKLKFHFLLIPILFLGILFAGCEKKNSTGPIEVEFTVDNDTTDTLYFQFSLVEASEVEAVIINQTRITIAELVNGYLSAGNHQVSFVITDVPEGIYAFYMKKPNQNYTWFEII